jgi:5S rRNA maturation endonuclease (ribonuclease M5)
MSRSLKRRLEEIQLLLDNLIAKAADGTPIIVEGLRDKESLENLEVKGDIISAKTAGKTFLDVLQEIENREKDEVILLMDFDKRGREMTTHLAQSLENNRIKANTIFWKKLSSLVCRDVKDIEGLATYVQTLSRKTGKSMSNPSY